MFERPELVKLAVNILLVAPVIALLFYRRFDAIFKFVAIWWLFSFSMTILHYLAVANYSVEYIAYPLLLGSMIAAIIANVSAAVLILPEIIKKIK